MKKNILFILNNEVEFPKRKILIKSIKNRGFNTVGVATDLKHNHDILDQYVNFSDINRNKPWANLLKNIESLKEIITKYNPQAIFLSHIQITILFLFLPNKLIGNKCFLIMSGLGRLFHEYGYMGKLLFYLLLMFARFRNINFLVQGSHNFKIIKRNFKCLEYPPSTSYNFLSRKTKREMNILSVGRICKGKGLDEFITSAQKLKELYSFKWIGIDETEKWLNSQNSEIQSFFYPKQISKSEVYREMENHKFFLHPSLHEGIPNVCIEANSANCLIIHNKLSQLSSNGLAVEELEYKNQEELEEILLLVSKSKVYQELLSKQMKVFKDNFSSDLIERKYFNLLKELGI